MTHTQIERLPEILFEIGKAIGSDDDLGAMLNHISALVTELTGAEATSIMLVDEERRCLLGKAAYGLDRNDISAVSFEFGVGVAGWVARAEEPALIPDVGADDRFVTLPDSDSKIRSLACVPLSHRGALVGVMTVTAPVVGAFAATDVDLLRFVARTIALDIENLRLRRLAVTDKLTGAFNREFLGQHLPTAIEDSRRRGDPLAIAMVDVDHFKDVNDHFGHDVGDDVLAEVARRLRASIRADDVLIRYGGEEFLVVLPNTELTVARDVSERMRERMQSAPIRVGDGTIDIHVSVGVAELTASEPEVALVKRADAALYRAKESGRNRVEVAH